MIQVHYSFPNLNHLKYVLLKFQDEISSHVPSRNRIFHRKYAVTKNYLLSIEFLIKGMWYLVN